MIPGSLCSRLGLVHFNKVFKETLWFWRGLVQTQNCFIFNAILRETMWFWTGLVQALNWWFLIAILKKFQRFWTVLHQAQILFVLIEVKNLDRHSSGSNWFIFYRILRERHWFWTRLHCFQVNQSVKESIHSGRAELRLRSGLSKTRGFWTVPAEAANGFIFCREAQDLQCGRRFKWFTKEASDSGQSRLIFITFGCFY